MNWRFHRLGRVLATFGILGASAVGCTSCDDAGSATSSQGVSANRCVVRLHGKGGQGGDSTVEAGVATLYPEGNVAGWGGRQWLYFPQESYLTALAAITESVSAAECDTVVIAGFSNGASFAAKLYCGGETLNGALVGVVIDDPVTDAGVTECSPSPVVQAALYWTSALERSAPAGADCGAIDWTCEGGRSIGIEAYAVSLGLAVQASIHTDHQPYWTSPEIAEWLQAPA